MGARWAWTAVCAGPEHHVYSNFSGGADNCYTCDAEPEMEWQDDSMEWGIDSGVPSELSGVEDYAKKRRAGVTREAIINEAKMIHGELALMRALAKRFGYDLVKKEVPSG